MTAQGWKQAAQGIKAFSGGPLSVRTFFALRVPIILWPIKITALELGCPMMPPEAHWHK